MYLWAGGRIECGNGVQSVKVEEVDDGCELGDHAV